MSFTSSVDRSCANVAIPCVDGTTYIDPCSCTHYYRCASTQKVELLNCSDGTLFDPTSLVICPARSDVSCKAEKPWERCSYVNNSESQEILEKRCAGASSSSPSPTGGGGSSSSLLSSTGGGGKENGSAIAGAIFAVLIITVIVVCIVLYVRKRGNPIRHLKQTSCWRGLTRTGKRKENGATCPAVYVITPPPEPEEEVYARIDDLDLWRDSQLVTTRATTPPRDLANNTHHQQNDYLVIPAGCQKTNKRQSPEQHTPNLAGHSTQTQDLVCQSTKTEDLAGRGTQTQDLGGHITQKQDLVGHSKQTQDLAGHSTKTQDSTGHSTQAVTDQSSPLYSGVAEVDDGLYIHAYASLGSQS